MSHWIFDTETNQFVFSYDLFRSNLRVHEEKQVLLSSARWSAGMSHLEYIKFIDGEPVVFRILLYGVAEEWYNAPSEITYEALMGITHSRMWGEFKATFELIDGKWVEVEVTHMSLVSSR